ncbi:glycosyltransferase family 4 protein [Vibrio breoganii]|uniref:glycosyltransferase family 4 protein n=1 Tax=Vibrio breoganii TaxID=553239 RepID=UPI0021C278FC|nr:glycosyltransferase family 4 protein [Vibrio breoganii]MDN3715929.1 glycosyltransferase family 4 protein [Vibrio breoganii]
MKKLLFITSSFPYGEGESFIKPEIEYLGRFHELTVIPTYPRGKLRNDVNYDSTYNSKLSLFSLYYCIGFIRFCFTKPLKLFKLLKLCKGKLFIKTIRNIILLPKAVFISKVLCKEKNYDFIYCHWLSAPSQLSLLISTLTNIPFGITAHRWDLIDDNNTLHKLSSCSFLRLISKKSCELLDKDLYLNNVNKISVIYMGVDIKRLIVPEFRCRQQTFHGVCVASLIDVKGHKVLLDSISILKANGFQCKISIIGDGYLRDELVKLTNDLDICNEVTFLGSLNHLDVLDLISSKQVNFMCLPSLDLGEGLHEGVPVSLMEAMGSGLPCISTNTGSIGELIKHKNNGILVDQENSTQLADAIYELYSNQDLYNSIAINSVETIKYKFNAYRNNGSLNELIKNNIK